MDFTLHIWRQENQKSLGKFVSYEVCDIAPDDSFLEMLDLLNENLIAKGEDIIAFDFDCREGICGACSLVINGHPHGKQKATTTCQLYMREYKNLRELWIEPFRSKAMPVIKDLIVDRSGLDNIIKAGGYIDVNTGNAASANSLLIEKKDASLAFDAAACIGCGACIAVCPNSSATLFVAAKFSHLDYLPQGKINSKNRVEKMLNAMADNGFGSCSNHKHCSAVCPKEISLENIKNLNWAILG
jgi:succinate dehydrogenase / fumarate reductase iron-sulfur subunit